MRRVLPAPLFITAMYLQSSVSSSIHLTQRGVLGMHFFRCGRELFHSEWLMRFNILTQGEMDLPLSGLCANPG